MGLRRRHGRSFSAALAFLLVFIAAIGGCYGGLKRNHNEEYEIQRRLMEPGSSPPTCRWRCGQCNPCRPIHVAVHPGRIVPLEYYPEAWRCQCGNQLFMP